MGLTCGLSLLSCRGTLEDLSSLPRAWLRADPGLARCCALGSRSATRLCPRCWLPAESRWLVFCPWCCLPAPGVFVVGAGLGAESHHHPAWALSTVLVAADPILPAWVGPGRGRVWVSPSPTKWASALLTIPAPLWEPRSVTCLCGGVSTADHHPATSHPCDAGGAGWGLQGGPGQASDAQLGLQVVWLGAFLSSWPELRSPEETFVGFILEQWGWITWVGPGQGLAGTGAESLWGPRWVLRTFLSAAGPRDH